MHFFEFLVIFYTRGQLESAQNPKSPEIPKNPQTILQFRAKIAGEDGPLSQVLTDSYTKNSKFTLNFFL